jgi:hypothetical protein
MRVIKTDSDNRCIEPSCKFAGICAQHITTKDADNFAPHLGIDIDNGEILCNSITSSLTKNKGRLTRIKF